MINRTSHEIFQIYQLTYCTVYTSTWFFGYDVRSVRIRVRKEIRNILIKSTLSFITHRQLRFDACRERNFAKTKAKFGYRFYLNCTEYWKLRLVHWCNSDGRTLTRWPIKNIHTYSYNIHTYSYNAIMTKRSRTSVSSRSQSIQETKR